MDLAVKPGFSGLCNTILLGGKIIDYVYLEADHLFSLWNIAQHHDNVIAETEIQVCFYIFVFAYFCIYIFLYLHIFVFVHVYLEGYHLFSL